MDDLRLVRREDQSLIVATESGEEYRLLVDETVLAELRHLARPARSVARINPREVQALVRAGKTRAEVAALTGLEEGDVERYEAPVLAERRYILELAHAVAVRTSPADEEEQQFGTVIAERLIGLGAEDPQWSSWRDEEAGWMVALSFSTREADHRAVWSFDHRKNLLAPLSPDADSLSKQGQVGERLIPKLRAVDADERFDSGAFDPERLTADFEEPASDDAAPSDSPVEDAAEPRPSLSGPVAPDHPSTGSIPVVDAEAEYARRQHIEERAIKTPAPELPDLGQTADLLDALRRRRGARDAEAAQEAAPAESAGEGAQDDASVPDPLPFPGTAPVTPLGSASQREEREAPAADVDPAAQAPVVETPAEEPEAPPKQPLGPAPDRNRKGKGRASIPSWDDILFGTRSEDDPA